MTEPSRKRPGPDTADYGAEEILETVQALQELRGSVKARQEAGRKMYPEFAERYPVLFEMACTPGFNMTRLRHMLGLRESVRSDHMSLDQASAQVGQELFNIYVKDSVASKPADKA